MCFLVFTLSDLSSNMTAVLSSDDTSYTSISVYLILLTLLVLAMVLAISHDLGISDLLISSPSLLTTNSPARCCTHLSLVYLICNALL